MSTVKCVFNIENNKLVRVSGADAGTYEIVNNRADIKIAGTTYTINPFDSGLTDSTDNKLTIYVTQIIN